MRRVHDIDRFSGDPVGRYVLGPTYLVWCASPTLCGSVAWGAPGERDVRDLCRLFDLSRSIAAGHDVFMDSAGIESVDWSALAILRDYTKSRLEEWSKRIRRQAVIVPPGPSGIILSGLVPFLGGSAYPLKFFSARGEAFAWLSREDVRPAVEQIEALVDEARGVSAMVRALRDHLEGSLLSASVESAARAMAVTPRSLQRELKARGTTFSVELAAARVRAGSMLLAHSDDKIESIARKVGCSSASHFAALFRKTLGETPLQYRTKHRSQS